MGYRSDVRLLTTKKGYDQLSKFVREKIGDSVDYNLLENCDIKSVHHNAVYMGWNSTKWYEGDVEYFKDVDAIMKGLEYLNDNKFSYHYARFGEDYNDVDEFCSDYKEDELDIFPCFERHFDDDYVIKELQMEDKYYRKLQEKEKDNDLLQN